MYRLEEAEPARGGLGDEGLLILNGSIVGLSSPLPFRWKKSSSSALGWAAIIRAQKVEALTGASLRAAGFVIYRNEDRVAAHPFFWGTIEVCTYSGVV